jgi:gentisate 1,2-dioxygenase
MFGIVPVGSNQAPHSHKSVALDFVAYAAPGTYTLVGDKVDPVTQQIIDPIRIDWVTGKAFVTPPGLWHSHHNESGEAAFIIPIQDAGLQTYLRTLDIQFANYTQE